MTLATATTAGSPEATGSDSTLSAPRKIGEWLLALVAPLPPLVCVGAFWNHTALTAAWVFIYADVVILAAWFLSSRWPPPLAGYFAGPLCLGGAMALAAGSLLPVFGILGGGPMFLIFSIGASTSFALAWVFLRHGLRAAAAHKVAGGNGRLAIRASASTIVVISAAWGIATLITIGWDGLHTNRLWTLVSNSLPEASDCGLPCFRPKFAEKRLRAEGFRGRLWLLGDAAWQSSDGVAWASAGVDGPWKDRRGYDLEVFRDRLWLVGGVSSSKDAALMRSDVWSTGDGVAWGCDTPSAPWSPRVDLVLVAFKDALWVLGGQVGLQGLRDIWTSPDGVEWLEVSAQASWQSLVPGLGFTLGGRLWVAECWGSPKLSPDMFWWSLDGEVWERAAGGDAPWRSSCDNAFAVHDGRLWILGGERYALLSSQGTGEIWESGDGKQWNRLTGCAPWGPRHLAAAVSFEGKLWVLGGCRSGGASLQDVWALKALPSMRAR